VQNKEISKEYLSSLYDSILFKDIVLRHKVRFSNQLRDISTGCKGITKNEPLLL